MTCSAASCFQYVHITTELEAPVSFLVHISVVWCSHSQGQYHHIYT